MRIVSACVISACLALASPAAAITGGTDTPITAAPWQVLVWDNFGGFNYCGGSIIDATHVLTAAHCLLQDIADPHSGTIPPANFRIYAGTGHVYPQAPENPSIQEMQLDPGTSISTASAVAADPRYDGKDFDAGVITLSSALDLNGTTRRAVGLAPVAPSVGDPLSVTGWGDTNDFFHSWPSNGALQRTTVTAATCDAPNVNAQGTMVCTVGAPGDICAGDSGGALVNAGGQQVGVVSGGTTNACSNVTSPHSFYANVADCRVRGFILSVVAPGSPDPCLPPPTTPTTPGQPSTTPGGTTDPGGQPGGTAASNDTSRPKTTFTDAKCTFSQCVVHARVADAAPSSGIKSLRATVRIQVRKSCRKHGRKRTCTRTTYRKLTTSVLPDGRYELVARGLPKARNRFSARATDNAGNVETRSVFVTRHTPPLKKR